MYTKYEKKNALSSLYMYIARVRFLYTFMNRTHAAKENNCPRAFHIEIHAHKYTESRYLQWNGAANAKIQMRADVLVVLMVLRLLPARANWRTPPPRALYCCCWQMTADITSWAAGIII